MRKECFEAARALKTNNAIIISRPDKGSGVVVLDRNDYVNKMLVILEDRSKFRQLGPAVTFDYTLKIEQAFQKRINAMLSDKKNPISKAVYDEIYPSKCQRSKMYGLPKTHKPDVPVRPVLSMIGSPQHSLAKWLVRVLDPVLSKYSLFTVKDSFSFSECIRGLRLNMDNTYICSYDIKSLFTSVPLQEVLKICINELYNSEITPPQISQVFLKELLEMATMGVQFSFNNMMYEQTDGVAMGSPLGPILANIFVGFHEQQLMSRTKPPILYKRYVDDTFTIFETKEQCDTFFNELSLMHPSLSFTCEPEYDNKLPFLDVFVEKNGDSFLTSIYRKSTFTGEYISWGSFNPSRRKINLISCLALRASKICSPSKLPEELAKITKIFTDLGYPDDLVRKTIKRATMERDKANKIQDFVYLRLPYIGPISEVFRKQLSKAVDKCFADVRLRTIFSTRTLFNGPPKDRTPTLDLQNVVYKFVCRCDSVYVGRTSHRLQKRIKEHVPASLLNACKINSKPIDVIIKSNGQPYVTKLSSIGQHLKENPKCGKEFDKAQFSVVARARSDFHLKVLEAVYLKLWSPNLCVQKEYVYNTILFKTPF